MPLCSIIHGRFVCNLKNEYNVFHTDKFFFGAFHKKIQKKMQFFYSLSKLYKLFKRLDVINKDPYNRNSLKRNHIY
jgi:hypothetical protein